MKNQSLDRSRESVQKMLLFHATSHGCAVMLILPIRAIGNKISYTSVYVHLSLKSKTFVNLSNESDNHQVLRQISIVSKFTWNYICHAYIDKGYAKSYSEHCLYILKHISTSKNA